MSNTDSKRTTIALPVRVALGFPLRIKDAGDVDGGWSVIECVDAAQARQIMADYPSAAMPCWRRPDAAWNRAA